MDLDLRKLRYFIAVAELLHFGRAAEALYIAQPVLSRQIRALERDLGAPLFIRDRRGTELTPAGEQLLADARPLLASAEAARRRVGGAASGSQTFSVGFMPGLIVSAALRALRHRHPEITVDVVRTGPADQVDVIHNGRVDVSYVRLPVDMRGLRFQPLLTEPHVAVLPADHHLTGKSAIEVAELAGETLLQRPHTVPEWPDIAAAVAIRPPRGPEPALRTVEEKLEHVAAGHGIVVLPMSTAIFYRRPDVAHVPLSDIDRNQVGLAWDRNRRSPLIHEFVTLASGVAEQSVQRPGA